MANEIAWEHMFPCHDPVQVGLRASARGRYGPGLKNRPKLPDVSLKPAA
jgi:hypothetical protein